MVCNGTQKEVAMDKHLCGFLEKEKIEQSQSQHLFMKFCKAKQAVKTLKYV